MKNMIFRSETIVTYTAQIPEETDEL